jgi:hypothetical protein
MLSSIILAYISSFNDLANTTENIDLAVYNYRLYIALLRLKGINICKIEPELYYILTLSLLYL